MATADTGRSETSRKTNLALTARIAAWSARNPWLVLLAAVVVIGLAVVAITIVGTEERGQGEGVGESGQGSALLDEGFGAPAGALEQTAGRQEGIIFSNPTLDVSDPEFKQAVDAAVLEIRSLPSVTGALSFYDTGNSALASADRRAVLASVGFAEPVGESGTVDLGPVLASIARSAEASPGFSMELYSFRLIDEQIDEIITEDFNRILVISLIVGLVILALAFKALVAAIIPLTMAVVAIFSAIGAAAMVSQAYPLVELYAEMILLMGLAVGIDYSLFIVSRFRDEREAGRPKLEAISTASNTTGRAVFYAGFTVILSLAGLTLIRDSTFISLAMGAIIVVFIAVVASLTLLPALLSVLGDNINRLRIPFVGQSSLGSDFWTSITNKVLARPLTLAVVAAGLLIALAVPLGSLNIGFNGGADSLPDAVEGKTGVALLEEHFSSSLIVPTIIVVEAADVNTPEIQGALSQFLERVANEPAFLGPFETLTNQSGNLLRIEVPVAGKVDDEQSELGVASLRNAIIPETFGAAGATAYVTGATAEGVDFTSRMTDAAPFVFAFVLGLSFLLLLFMFRSIVIPIKALVLNLLSVAAAYGVLVMVFQWGWGISILGTQETGIIEAWLPLFLFGILFGLSMDYHMLLLNRIKEEYDKGQTNQGAVSQGIQLTAGQITSAAAIMIGVFAAFATSRVLGLQQFGLGLAVAVFLDVTLIRVVLLPAAMKLLGEWNWYLPSWMEWLPRFTGDEDRELGAAPGTAAASGDD